MKVNNGSVSGSSSMIDGGTSFTCYYQHAQLLHYFAKAGAGSYHCVYGPVAINPYKNRDSNKPCVSVNVLPWKVGPAIIENGKIQTKFQLETENVAENLKLKLVAYLFMMAHWGQETAQGILLDYQLGNKDSLAESIRVIVAQLQQAQLLDVNAQAPIERQDLVLSAGSVRPGFVQQVHDYNVNPAYPSNIAQSRDDSWYETKFDIPVIATPGAATGATPATSNTANTNE